jgi:hypothetical protein
VRSLHEGVVEALGKGFKPLWSLQRPNYRRRDKESGGWATDADIKIHRVYPANATVHGGLRTNISVPFTRLGDPAVDEMFRVWVADNPCGELEVVFV